MLSSQFERHKKESQKINIGEYYPEIKRHLVHFMKKRHQIMLYCPMYKEQVIFYHLMDFLIVLIRPLINRKGCRR